jgi:hypothetical protein
MKKKSTSKSAFFNVRVLIALFIALAGVSLALVGLDAFPANRAPVKIKNNIIVASNDPLVPVGFDCSKIEALGIHKQENFRAGAIMIACGATEGGSVPSANGFFQRIGQAFKKLFMPLYGVGDVNLITGTETPPNITQSETFTMVNPENANEIVVAYNDSRGRNASPINISGASVSTDGGTTFTRLTLANGQSPFSNTVGDPVLLYHQPSHTWFTVWLDGACGGQGLGGYKSTNPSDPTSWTHFPCVHSNSQDDRNSGWSDNNPASPNFGKLFVSYNDFNVGGGALFVRRSTDGGNTWAGAQVTTSFIRDVQITGDKVTGNLYLAGMDEMGGGLTNRANKIYRSTDGGVTWTNTYTGPTFPGPGRSASGFFATMYGSPAYWRHMGWGEPAAYNNVVSLVYASRNTGTGDPGDVFYIRSTDSGVTFSAPFQLNANVETTKAQWMPNLSVSEAGTLLATWYDEAPRTSASCQPSSPTNLCYQMHSRKSLDNGLTWLADETMSDVASPLPLQQDPGIQPTYVGDYDYGSAVLTKHATSWADGRVIINGNSQQDAFTDREPVGPSPTASPSPTSTATASPTPTATATATPCQANYTTAVSTGTITPGGTDIGNHCDDCTTDIVLPFGVSVYGNPPVTSVAVGSDGDIHFPGPYNKLFWWMGCIPVDPAGGQDPFLNTFFPYYADLVTDETAGPCTGCGIFTQTVGTAPNRQFIIRWKTNYFNSPPGPAQAEFEVVLTEGSNTLTVIYGTTCDNGLTAVSGIQQDLTRFTSFSCNEAVLTPGVRVDYIPTTCGSPTPTPTSTPTATATATATPTATATTTATATATPTNTPVPTPRSTPSPRPRPTPPPRG